VEEHPVGSSKQQNCKGKINKSANKRKQIETLG
jgi:hypothetical protein